MIKVVALFRKKRGMSSAEFKDYYENVHAKLFKDVVATPGVERYVRRYLTPLRDAISGDTGSSGVDVVMEFWFSDQAVFERFFRNPLDTAFMQMVATDEEKLFDRSHMFLHTVEEVDSEITWRAPQGEDRVQRQSS